MNDEEKHEYYEAKSFREVNPPVDAPINQHLKMIGARHNTKTRFVRRDPFVESSDEEDVTAFMNDHVLLPESEGRHIRYSNFNKRLWMKTYSLRFEIPTSHVLDARTFTRGTDSHVM